MEEMEKVEARPVRLFQCSSRGSEISMNFNTVAVENPVGQVSEDDPNKSTRWTSLHPLPFFMVKNSVDECHSV
jgi:hypothetical protein